MPRFFNTEGPMKPEMHYTIDPLSRVDLAQLMELIESHKYFLLHAPRQTGKTSVMRALVKHLNATGRYRAVCSNIEPAQAAREDVPEAITAILSALADDAIAQLGDRFLRDWYEARRGKFTAGDLRQVLAEWAANDRRPLVLFLDEVDALIGDSLLSLLRQLRAGYPDRPERFPQAMILCGIRDIRDYRIESSREKAVITGGSAFNIKAESLRLGDFTKDEIRALYLQHTAETGQLFEEPVFDLVWRLTLGQPWLVNALVREATHRKNDYSQPVRVAAIEAAKEKMIVDRVTHIDQLGAKLREDRVRRVVAPILAGSIGEQETNQEDAGYTIDLGIVRRGPNGLEIANPIYREVIPRYLTADAVDWLMPSQKPDWYITGDGRLDMVKLLEAFQQFFRENSEHWVKRFDYQESGPQLLLQAFLQRIINGGGTIEREYGLGRMRTDLLIRWPWKGGEQRIVIELKLTRKAPTEKWLDEGLAQTAEYLQRTGLGEGHLVLFDRSERTWDEKVYRTRREHGGRIIEVWGM
ncbi:MAG: ATP-binding protein [Acidobacteria bacterium]|nr:ATP-binding protein [Acidobacteriota bacterium]